jgi:hypothetical protein
LPVPPSSLPSSEQRLVDILPTTYTDTHANEIANLDLVGTTRRGFDMKRNDQKLDLHKRITLLLCVLRRVCARWHALSVGH